MGVWRLNLKFEKRNKQEIGIYKKKQTGDYRLKLEEKSETPLKLGKTPVITIT